MAVERGRGDESDGNSMSRAEKRVGETVGRDRGRRGWRGGGGSRRMGGGQDIGEGATIPEGEAPGLTAGGGDCDFI